LKRLGAMQSENKPGDLRARSFEFTQVRPPAQPHGRKHPQSRTFTPARPCRSGRHQRLGRCVARKDEVAQVQIALRRRSLPQGLQRLRRRHGYAGSRRTHRRLAHGRTSWRASVIRGTSGLGQRECAGIGRARACGCRTTDTRQPGIGRQNEQHPFDGRPMVGRRCRSDATRAHRRAARPLQQSMHEIHWSYRPVHVMALKMMDQADAADQPAPVSAYPFGPAIERAESGDHRRAGLPSGNQIRMRERPPTASDRICRGQIRFRRAGHRNRRKGSAALNTLRNMLLTESGTGGAPIGSGRQGGCRPARAH